MGAPSARASELARHWARDGHDVTVLTGFPNHPTGEVPFEYQDEFRSLVTRERIEGVNLIRTWLWPLPNRRAYERILNYGSFCLSSAVTGLFQSRPEVVIATSPQLLVGLAGWWLAFCKRVPFVFEVRDLWPESLSAVGAAAETSLMHRSLAGIAGFLYRKASRIVVVSPAFKDHLIKHWQVPAGKISVIENGVETNLFGPQNADPDLRRELGAEGKFLVSYIGTIGVAQGLESLLEAASRMQHCSPDVLFLLVGDGAEKERIQSLASARGLTNVRCVAQQPRERIPAYIAASDACVVLLKKADLFKTVIPTKMLESMSCARPVILGVDGQSRKIIEESQAGICIEPGNADHLVQAVAHLAANPVLRESLGRNGRRYIQQNFSRRITAAAYLDVLEDLLESKSPYPAVAA